MNKILKKLEKEDSYKLTAIWTTHHHWDHASGNEAVTEAFGGTNNVKVIGPKAEADKIPALTNPVKHGDQIDWCLSDDYNSDIKIIVFEL